MTLPEHAHTEFVPDCPTCAETAMLEGFHGEQAPAKCPCCGQEIAAESQAPEIRVTEADEPAEEPAVDEPDRSAVSAGAWVSWKASSGTRCGRVTSLHTASTVPGVSRKVIGTADAPAARIKVYAKAQVGEGWVPTGRYTALPVADLAEIEAPTLSPLAAGEAIGGQLSVNDKRSLLCDAIEERAKVKAGVSYVYIDIIDFTDNAVVYGSGDDLFQASYTMSGLVVEVGEPVKVIRTVVYQPVAESSPPEPSEPPEEPGPEPEPGPSEPGPDPAPQDGPEAAAEASTEEERDRLHGRIVESKGVDETGGRVYRTRLIAYGESKNRRRYPESVMRGARDLYEGAKAYDHHRTPEELASSTINGIVGSFRNVAAEADGLYADLHLLPGAIHAAETLDASLAAQEAGLPPLVGLSHDVLGRFRPIVEGGRRLQEATQITKVHSVDLVESPAAGGRAERAVAGGETTTTEPGNVPAHTEEDAVPPTVEEILGALKEATPEQLAAIGLNRAEEAGDKQPEKTGDQPAAEAAKQPEAPAVPVAEAKTDGHARESFMGGLLIKSKVQDAGLPEAYVEAVRSALPERISESDVDAQIAAIKHGLGLVERAGLAPKAAAPGEGVVAESMDKKKAALDAFFDGKFSEGYRSFRQAFMDITGRTPRNWDEDFNRVMLRESIAEYDSAVHASEALNSGSWAMILGDSITRRLVAEYRVPSLETWRRIVSSIVPVTDFRTQHIGRVGGYGTLPTVGQGQPYQPLTSPGEEEATYAITKKGGTEDLTLEMIANDDVRAIRNIPSALGRAAAHTLHRFVFGMLTDNVVCTYDSTALFHTNHANTDNPALLGQSTLSIGRRRMRKQAAFGVSTEILSIVPRLLLVPSDLEELAFQLTTSAVAVPSTPAGPSDTPNLHSTLDYQVVDYWSDPNDWFLVADPNQIPTIEVGFYQGRETPELFTQSDPTVGSMFNADVITYKIRHIYNGTVLDHRGFYRGANA